MNLPNQLTLLRILLTPVFVFLFFLDHWGWHISAFAVFALASITDFYDGYWARRLGEITTWGQFLDPLADKMLVSSGLICFSVIGLIPEWMVLVIVVRDLLMTGFRSYAMLKGEAFKTNFFGKAKTTGQFITIYLIFIFHLFQYRSGPADSGLLKWVQDWQMPLVLVLIITVFTVLSFILYVFENRDLLKRIAMDIRKAMAVFNST